MNIKRFLIIYLLMLVLLVVSCGGKREVKRETEESRIAKEAVAIVEMVKEAYMKKDIETIMRHVSKDTSFSITKDFQRFDFAELIFKPVFTEIQADKVILNISWQGKWYRGSDIFEDRGMVVFIMTNKPLKIDKILRANPFFMPE